MPTYAYVCAKCGHEFDLFQSMKDAPLKTCPKERCGRKTWGRGAVKRQIGTGAGLIFKGSGFYITDYRSRSYQEAAKKDSAPAAPAAPATPAAPAAAPSSSPAPAVKPAAKPAGEAKGGGAKA